MERNSMQQDATATTPLSPVQIKVIVALAAGSTLTDAAQQAKVDRTTVYRWMRGVPEFIAELNRAKAEQRRRFQELYSAVALDAVETVRQLMKDSYVASELRLKAALSILDRADPVGPESVEPPAPSV